MGGADLRVTGILRQATIGQATQSEQMLACRAPPTKHLTPKSSTGGMPFPHPFILEQHAAGAKNMPFGCIPC